MNVELRKPQRPFPTTHATIRLALPAHAIVPWIPFPGLVGAMLRPPSAESLGLHANVSSLLGIAPMVDGWHDVEPDAAFAEVRVLPAALVTTGDTICSITAAKPWLVTEAIERIVVSLRSLSLLWIFADARECARRCAARTSELNTLAWSELSCVVRPHTVDHEVAGATVFNQAPWTADGIVAVGSPRGRHVTFASSMIDSVTDMPSWQDARADTIWLASSANAFDAALEAGGCIPIVPPERDVSYVMKHARHKAPCGLRSLGKRYGFVAASSSDAQQGFRSLVNVGMCPLEAIAVLDVDAMSPPVLIERSTAHPPNLIRVADVDRLDSAAASKLMFN